MGSPLRAIVSCFTVLLLGACGPTFNWRETPIAATSVVALFPCKPILAMRPIALGGHEMELHMAACDASDLKVAVGRIPISEQGLSDTVLVKWREATLLGMRADPSGVAELANEHIRNLPRAVGVRAVGSRPDGRPLVLQGVWFATGTDVFAALMYADQISPGVTEAFFSGLGIR